LFIALIVWVAAFNVRKTYRFKPPAGMGAWGKTLDRLIPFPVI
jgi:hypothetical protein